MIDSEPEPHELRGSYLPDIHRLLPQSLDAERGILCSFLLDAKRVGALCAEHNITEATFHLPAHATIFGILLDAWNDGEPCDFILLTERLKAKGQLDQCGGPALITDLFTFLPTAANAEFYISKVQGPQVRRKIIQVCTEHAALAYEDASDEATEALVDRLEEKVLGIRSLKRSERPTMRELAMGSIQHMEEVTQRNGAISGISYGFNDLDRMTDGLKMQELVVIAARPSHGKTALALNIVEHVAINLKQPVAVFSLEMSAQQLSNRLLCSIARVDYYRWRDGGRRERDFPALQVAASHMSVAPIYIEDASGQSIQEMRATARRLRSEKGIVLAVIDYLQIATSNTKRAKENRQIEVAEISGGGKSMARELNISVLALAQIDRNVEKHNRRPRLSDLKESGAIEQDADTVAFLTRDELNASDDEERDRLRGVATLDIAKQRSGPIGPVPLTFLKEFTRFESRAREQEPEEAAQGSFI